jgi:indolepyruvate decarboxylase
MTNPTVAEYVVKRLSDLGIDKVFGVPGDYAFPIDDAIEVCPTLDWVGCANELNAAYAADGYARRKGAAILTTTYAVGELSAINGVMGSKAHRLPVFHLVGAPSRRITHQHLITHHTLGNGVYGNFESLSAAACCVSALLCPDNAIDELERVIREALRQSSPAYIVIPMDYARMQIVGTPVKGLPLASIKRQSSASAELEGALKAVLNRLKAAKNPVVLPTAILARYGLQKKLSTFLDKSQIPYATTPMDKGVISEGHSNYLGLYNGDGSFPLKVRETVQGADLVLDLGGVIFEDLNTGLWSDAVPAEHVIRICDHWVQLGTKIYSYVAIEDMLDGLIAQTPVFPRKVEASTPALLPLSGKTADKLGSASFYPRLQRFLKSGDVLVIETGTCMLHLGPMWLPAGVGCETQTLWGSIGWATPATLGVTMANDEGRTIVVTGDGSHQLTLNEIAVMGRYGTKPIIFVLNNGIYGVEDVLSERGHEYDNLAPLNYHLLPEAMGCKGWLSRRVSTIGELEDVFSSIDANNTGAYIEVMIPEDESRPLPVEIIDRIYKFRTPSAE